MKSTEPVQAPTYTTLPIDLPIKPTFKLAADGEDGSFSERSLVAWEIFITEHR